MREANIIFGTNLDCWILIPTIGIARYNNDIGIGVSFLCFGITIIF